MIKILERFFKQEPDFSYTIAEYMPLKANIKPKPNKLQADTILTEYDLDRPTETDEMQIDKIYNRL